MALQIASYEIAKIRSSSAIILQATSCYINADMFIVLLTILQDNRSGFLIILEKLLRTVNINDTI